MKKAGIHINKAYTTILLLLVVAFLSVIYYFITSIKHERQTEKLIQRTQTSIHLSNHLQRLIDTFHLLSAPLFYTDKKTVSTEQQRIGTLVKQELIVIRNNEHIEPAQLAAIDSIEKFFNQLTLLIYDTVPGSIRRDQPPVILRDEYKLSAAAIRLLIGGIRDQEEENLLHYQENIKEDKYLLNLRIFLLLAVILLLSIIFTWQLWNNYKTNRKAAALQTYNNFLLDNIDDAIISTDLQDTIMSWNKGAEAIFGWKEEEAIGKKLTELFPDDKSIDEYKHRDLSRDRTFFKGEVKQNDKAGNILYIRKTVSPVYNELRQHTGFVSINMDITASKEQEEAMKSANELLEIRIRERTSNLLRANKLYHFISELNKMILQTTDERTLYKEICDIAIQFGKFRMAWIGLIDTETGLVRPVIHAGNEEGYLSIIKPISIRADVPEGRGPTGLALREGTYFVCQDVAQDPRVGPWREEQLRRGYLSSMAVPIRKSGVIVGAITVYAPETNFFNEAEISLMLAAADDITFALDYLAREEQRLITEKQLAESEEKFRTLVEKSLAGVYIIQDNIFTYINTRFAEIFGYDHPEDIMGKLGIEELVAPVDLDLVSSEISNRLTGKITSSHYTIRARKRDQSYLYLEVAGSYILYKNQPAILGTLFDITYQVEEEIRIGKAVINAQENERQQIGMELHDNVKQILAATQMYLGMANGKLNNTQQEVAGLLAKSRGFISDSILELRKLSHQLAPSASGNISFEESIGMLVKNMSADQSMDVFLNIESFAPDLISKDILTTFYRILQEQLNNIKKHAVAKEVIISTSLSDDYIHLSITDNGKGFDPATVKEGIGLENIRRRVKFFDGSVKVISSPGKGCEIQVDIPLLPLKE